MSTTIKLINTGILMGIIHVLTGPDHLSALATLSGTTVNSHKRFASFLLGVKWGLGHSLGLLLVGGILIAMEDEASKEQEWIGVDHALSTIFEWFVGIFMLLLGCYGIHKACKNRRDAASSSFMSYSSKEDLRRQQEEHDEYIYNDQLDEDEEAMMMNYDNNRRGAVEMPAGNRRSSMEIIEQMADVLNRDGDSMREGSVEASRREGDFVGVSDVEARILHASESLRRNSSSDNLNFEGYYPSSAAEDDDHAAGSGYDGDDERFMNTLKKSAKGALSDSFVQILTKDQPPMKASQFVRRHSAQDPIILDNYSNVSYPPINCNNCCTPDILALLAGILHGVAGPGGVLGVIPAVQLRDAKLASIYLSTFCLTSTLVMGSFAAFYGSFSEWLARGSGRGRRGGCTRVFLVEIGSASLSIVVGVVWLVLLTVGKLQEVFP